MTRPTREAWYFHLGASREQLAAAIRDQTNA